MVYGRDEPVLRQRQQVRGRRRGAGRSGGPLRWLVIDCAAIVDVDYTASMVLLKVVEHAHEHDVHLALSSVLGPVRRQLDDYGISEAWVKMPTSTRPARPSRPSTRPCARRGGRAGDVGRR